MGFGPENYFPGPEPRRQVRKAAHEWGNSQFRTELWDCAIKGCATAARHYTRDFWAGLAADASANSRHYSLDVTRGLAAIIVMIWYLSRQPPVVG